MGHSYCNQLQNKEKDTNMSKGGAKTNDVAELTELFKKLTVPANHSLLRKHLDKELFDKLKDKKTKFNGTLNDCIRSGALNEKSHCGVYACDPDAYNPDTFGPLLDRVILDYHKCDKINHPSPNFGTDKEVDELGDLDPKNEMVLSTRVRVGRSHDAFPFCPVLTKEQRLEMEKLTVDNLNETFKDDPEYKGKYYALSSMKPEDEKQLIEDHFLFKNDDSMLGDAGGYDDWPAGRGIYHNEKKTFLVWLNEEDHLRFISMQKGGNLTEVYNRLRKAINSMEKGGLQFAKRDGYGYLTFCPTNLGTTMRASVHIKIPKLSQQPDFKEICEKLHLQPRGIHGENTESVGGVYDISNKRRLGLTEIQAITEMKNGIIEIIKKEKAL